MNFFKGIVGGRLTAAPELRYTQNQTAIATGSIAINSWKKDIPPIFMPYKLWGKRGEAFAAQHDKGDMALLDGSVEMEAWADKKTGEERSRLVLNANDWQMVKQSREVEAPKTETEVWGDDPFVPDEDTAF